MFQKLYRHKGYVATSAGICLFLSYPKYNLFPLIFLFPFFINTLVKRCENFRQGFLWGFYTSFVIMLGGFYWVVFVLHEFGYLPWWLAALMYLGFCGFGALNFPLYTGIAAELRRRFQLDNLKSPHLELWHGLGLPALFTLVEFCIPKLFPWVVGHSLYRAVWLTQIVEITGCTFLTFSIFSLGGLVALAIDNKIEKRPLPKPVFWAIPASLWILCIAFSAWRLSQPLPEKHIQVALIQANIGSLEKVQAKHGVLDKVRSVLDAYERLTEEAMKRKPRPELLVWPETAMPFQLQMPTTVFARELQTKVLQWGVPLITGGYAVSPYDFTHEYNSAHLLEPIGNLLHRDLYNKNILLAFGEYMPLGEWFPSLYQQFPEVGSFDRGKTQNAFTLKDGTRLGITICYEAIIPSFFRKVAKNEVNGVINLTNDSWFGPTAEPYLHGAITIFRSIESRLPLMRVTNTGTSFTVDVHGRMSEMTPVYDEGILSSEVHMPSPAPLTIYVRFGDWFILITIGLLVAFGVIFWRRNVSLPVR